MILPKMDAAIPTTGAVSLLEKYDPSLLNQHLQVSFLAPKLREPSQIWPRFSL